MQQPDQSTLPPARTGRASAYCPICMAPYLYTHQPHRTPPSLLLRPTCNNNAQYVHAHTTHNSLREMSTDCNAIQHKICVRFCMPPREYGRRTITRFDTHKRMELNYCNFADYSTGLCGGLNVADCLDVVYVDVTMMLMKL